MTWNAEQYLKGQHIRQLLQLRNACHKFNGYYDICDHSGCVVTIDQVLAELNTRPHLARGKEAKLLRRLMAENRMTDEQVRAIPKFATMLAQAQPRRVVSAETYNQYKMAAPECWVTKKMIVLPKP
jgi:hypothetical protein